MALINCPDCKKEVSNRADKCIFCGCPLNEEEYIVKFKTPANIGILKTKIKFYNDKTKELLAEDITGGVVSIKITEPTTIRIKIGKGWKDAILEYKPHSNARYCIVLRNSLFSSWLVAQEVDLFDSDRL